MTFSWNTPAMRLACGLFALVAVADLIGLYLTGITIDFSGLKGMPLLLAQILILSVFLLLIIRRLKGDDEKIGKFLSRFATTVHTILQVAAFSLVFSAFGALLSYLAIAAGLPLRDAEFAYIDQWIGLDWTAIVAWVNEHALVRETLAFAYHSSAMQITAMIFCLSIVGQIRNLQQFIALYCLTIVVVMIISGLAPTVGPYAFYNTPESLFSNMTPKVGSWHLEHFLALHNGTFETFDIRTAQGIITFPSFHVVLAIITAYAMRQVPYICWCFYALSFIVILSTGPEGGHYYIDLVAGAAIAITAIFFVRHRDGQATRIADLFPPMPKWNTGEALEPAATP